MRHLTLATLLCLAGLLTVAGCRSEDHSGHDMRSAAVSPR